MVIPSNTKDSGMSAGLERSKPRQIQFLITPDATLEDLKSNCQLETKNLERIRRASDELMNKLLVH